MATDLPGTMRGDEELIAVIVRRGESAEAMRAAHQVFESLYLRHGPLLRAFLAGRVARSDLDDLHQEIWGKVWARLPDGYRPGNFRAWLHQVARALMIDQHRRRKPEVAIHEPDLLAEGRRYHAEDELMERERSEAFRRCLERLEARSAELVRARLGGEGYSEACERLGIEPARAHKLFHLAKNQLKDCVERTLG
jgi:RNA polymerase sigma factor (sigma-70 family)